MSRKKIISVILAHLMLLVCVTACQAASPRQTAQSQAADRQASEAQTETTAPVVTGYFTLDGRPVDNPLRGNIYIQKMSNGAARKIFFK